MLCILCGQKDFFPNAIHSEMRPVYGDKCFTRPAIHVWCKSLLVDEKAFVNEKRPGRCDVLTNDE